jgi:hypothetical protein
MRALLPGAGRRALSTLPVFLANLSGSEGFANIETRSLLGQADIPLPAVENYLDRVLETYLRIGRRPRRGSREALGA